MTLACSMQVPFMQISSNEGIALTGILAVKSRQYPEAVEDIGTVKNFRGRKNTSVGRS